MSVPDYAIHLGGGLYLDSQGVMHQGKPPAAAVYEAPFELPVDPAKIRDAAKAVKDALKDIDKNKDVTKVFDALGMSTKLLEVLKVGAAIASVVAPIAAAGVVLVAAAKIFGLLKEGPNALEELVKAEFENLDKAFPALARLITTKDLRNGRVKVEGFTNAVKTYTDLLKDPSPSMPLLVQSLADARLAHQVNVDGVGNLLDPATWTSLLDTDEHNYIWMPLQPILFTMPDKAGQSPAPALVPRDNADVFDHRLMVPVVIFAAESYLAAIRGLAPDYRTTGEYRHRLRSFAGKLQALTDSMRRMTLARTIYQASHFEVPIGPGEVKVYGTFPNLTGIGLRPSNRWPVGAMDLRYHTNNYFETFLADLTWAEMNGKPHPTKQGCLDFRWTPPAKLEPGPFGDYRISNPQECADAANKQSEKDYAELLAASGYLELVQLTALLRHESTPPDRSQTVELRSAQHWRTNQSITDVTVTSGPILMTGVISSPARRETRQTRTSLRIRTQGRPRERQVEYQVKLRTLRSITARRSWHEPSYAEFQWSSYVPAATAPGFLDLVLTQSNADLDSQPLLAGWRTTPEQAIHAEDVVTLKADTFDWWVPVQQPFSLDEDFAKTMAALRNAGWHGIPDTSLALMYNTTTGFDEEFPASGVAPSEILKGEHADLRTADVQIEYELDWVGDSLHIVLKNKPDYRSYVVYVVLEEKLLGTGQVLHTAVPVPVNGLVTYVPQKFFDDKKAALDQVNDTFTEFNKKYSLSKVPDLSDPIVGWLRPGDTLDAAKMEQFVTLAREHEPQLFEEAMRAVERRA